MNSIELNNIIGRAWLKDKELIAQLKEDNARLIELNNSLKKEAEDGTVQAASNLTKGE